MKLELSNKDQGIYVFQLDKNNYIKVCPERGGVITNWVSDGNEILYFDATRFMDKTKSIGEVFQSCFQFVEISIPQVRYLEMVICNYHIMFSLGICNGNTPSMKMKNFYAYT